MKNFSTKLEQIAPLRARIDDFRSALLESFDDLSRRIMVDDNLTPEQARAEARAVSTIRNAFAAMSSTPQQMAPTQGKPKINKLRS